MKYLETMVNEIQHYVSNEVNWFEACTFYAEKHDIDMETIAEVIKAHPRLFAEVTDSARKMGVVKLDYASLF